MEVFSCGAEARRDGHTDIVIKLLDDERVDISKRSFCKRSVYYDSGNKEAYEFARSTYTAKLVKDKAEERSVKAAAKSQGFGKIDNGVFWEKVVRMRPFMREVRRRDAARQV